MKITDLKNRRDVGSWLNQAGLIGIGVEVGVAYGENAFEILSKWRGHCLLLVDPWKHWNDDEYIDHTNKIDFDGAFLNCMDRLSIFTGRYGVIRQTSDDAMDLLGHGQFLSFAYIDAAHYGDYFQRDLEGWYDMVLPGGLFGGHDYMDILNDPGYLCTVKTQVDDFVLKHNLKLHVTDSDEIDHSWWIQKPINL